MDKEEYVKISKTELKNLLWANETLAALENGGVEDWEFYSDAIYTYISDVYHLSIPEVLDRDLWISNLVEEEIKTYEKIS